MIDEEIFFKEVLLEEGDIDDFIDEESLNPEEYAIARELFFLRAGIYQSALPFFQVGYIPIQRRILSLLYEGYTQEEIGKKYGLSKSTIGHIKKEALEIYLFMLDDSRPVPKKLAPQKSSPKKIISSTSTTTSSEALPAVPSPKKLMINLNEGVLSFINLEKFRQCSTWYISIDGVEEQLEASAANAKKLIIRLLKMGYPQAFKLIKVFGLKLDHDLIIASSKFKKLK